MNTNFSKYPAEDRVKEMSKQEEILLKRKREIERRLGFQTGSSTEGEGKESPPSISPPLPKYVKKQQLHPIPSSDVVPVKPYMHRPSLMSGSKVNKFNNDGSFFEQFKKLTESQKGEVKEEKYSMGETMMMSSKATMPSSKVPLPKYRHPAFYDEGLDASEIPDMIRMKTEESMDDMMYPASVVAEGNKDVEHPDWFKEALKKVQEKARQLGSDSSVSLSAGSSENSVSPEAESQSRKRRSRWAETPVQEEVPPAAPPPPPVAPRPVVNLNVPDNLMTLLGEGEHIEAIRGVMVTRITRNSPAIYAYAHKVFGSLDLTEAQWKQCEEQMKMNVVFQLLQAKQKEADRLEQQGRVKYEYDSDEDVDGGTWEHKRRAKEMAETQCKAHELTYNAEGKHHIGDFLPPDELARFMEKYRAIKEGRDPDLSDYQEHKLTEDNIGYKMLKTMGWTEGMGLGIEGKGITTPVNQTGRNETQGLGVERPENLTDHDDEYDAYRKRMMLAYRFRPNPLNNPRRAYY